MACAVVIGSFYHVLVTARNACWRCTLPWRLSEASQPIRPEEHVEGQLLAAQTALTMRLFDGCAAGNFSS